MLRKLLYLLVIFNFWALSAANLQTDTEFIIETSYLSPQLRDAFEAFFADFNKDLPFAILVAPDDLLYISEEDDEEFTSFHDLLEEDLEEDVGPDMVDFVMYLQAENDELHRLLVLWYLEEIVVAGDLLYDSARELALEPPAGGEPA